MGVVTRGEVRQLPIYGPGGYVWLPESGASVLVIKGGPGGEEQCVCGGKQAEVPKGMQPGEVYIYGPKGSNVYLQKDGTIESDRANFHQRTTSYQRAALQTLHLRRGRDSVVLMLVNGDYVPQENGLQSAKGDEAVLQRMLMKLTARRGQFPFMENFGSRLWTLDRLRPAERQAAAEQYVLEALRMSRA